MTPEAQAGQQCAPGGRKRKTMHKEIARFLLLGVFFWGVGLYL